MDTDAQMESLSAALATAGIHGQINDYHFTDSCGCYSEWTTESCQLAFDLENATFDIPMSEDDMYNVVQGVVENWAHSYLSWSGCECCDSYLSVYPSVFPAKGA